MRRHPVLLGIALLFLIAAALSAALWGIGVLGDEGRVFGRTGKVAIVPIEGVIGDSEELVAQLREFSDDRRVAAVVLRIDSPGGGVAASQEVYQAVLELKKKKKVIASMGSVAASGGYLVAVAADRIVANPGTITGSISTVMHHANVEELMKKIGVRSSVVKSGKFKDIGSPSREMTPEERQLLQALVDDLYDQFIAVVALNRRLPREQLLPLADGRIFSGRQAKELGLVDELGGLQDAILQAGHLAGIDGVPEVVRGKRKKASLLRFLLAGLAAAVADGIHAGPAETRGAQYLFE